ncbi:MAG TPA: hypothetical protein PLW65_01935 [Pseudomonadota bacterium]|nr:hypothetical protein [Pseudomonadota bacterium]
MAEDLVVLREILQRELETINAYEKMIDRVSDPALKQIIEHVTDEEREHVAEMYQLIMARDERQQARSLRSEQQLREMHLTGGAAPRATAAASHAATAAAEAGLKDPLLVPSVPGALAAPAADDPFPPPPPIFPDGSWSVGWLKRVSPQAVGSAGATGAGTGSGS